MGATAAGGTARAVEAAVLCARSARTDDLLAQRLSCAKDPHGRIPARDAGLDSILLHRDAVDFDTPQRLGVFRLERGGEPGDALANRTLNPVVRIILLVELRG